MAETITKGELLTSMQAEYEQFETLLFSLNEQQMTMNRAKWFKCQASLRARYDREDGRFGDG